MDPISGSCISLNADYESEILSNPHECARLWGSLNSLGAYEKRNFKQLLPQIFAAIVTTSYHAVLGMSLAYSAILLPQLEDNPEFEMSRSAVNWVASIITVTGAIGLLLVGFLMDRYGRLNTLKMAAVPGVTGWCLIALSQNYWMLILGRGLAGFACSLGTSPAVVYLTEIGRKDMRGSLLSIGPAASSIGMIITYLLGWFVTWRLVAWICIIFNIIPVLLLIMVPESPSWLVAKGRNAEAKKSLDWMNRFQPPVDKTTELSDIQMSLLENEHRIKATAFKTSKNKWSKYRKPTFYKPLLLLTGLFFFQQFSGVFVFVLYAIRFFKDVGATDVNPYLASMFIGVLRLVVCLFNTYSLKNFGRRNLIMISATGMTLTVVTCALLANKNAWLPAVLLLMFKATSMIGLVPIPYTMTAELFPIEIRGVAHSVSIIAANFFMFVSLQIYPTLLEALGGISGLLYFYASIQAAAVVYVWIFLPETHGKTLKQIEEYLVNNIIYLGQKKNPKSERRSIVKKNHLQNDVINEEVEEFPADVLERL